MQERHESHLDLCLRPLLHQLNWQGDDALLFENMPHLMSIENVEKFSDVMHNLGYASKQFSIQLASISEKSLPCLFLPEDGAAPMVVQSIEENKCRVYDSQLKKERRLSDLTVPGVALSFKKKSEAVIRESYQHWFKEVLYDCKGTILFLVVIGLLQALLFIAPPAYIMFLYDKVINTNSYSMLGTFFIGMAFAMAALVGLMNIRSRVLGYFGSKLQRRIGNVIFMRLLKLQPAYIESAPLSRQMIRINDFNQLREFFGGALFSTVVDLPFAIVFLLFIWLIAGVMVLVPIIAIIVYLLVARLLYFFSRRAISENSIVRGKYQNYLLETFSGMRSLQFSGFQDKWFSNFKEISALFSQCGRNILFINSVSEAVFDALTLLTGMATLITGTVMIINDQLQIGALIAVLFVIWRLLAPVKMISTMYPKLVQIGKSAKQINDLMKFPTEIPAEHQWENSPTTISGNIRFDQVSFRYPNADTLALKNVSFTIKKGETVFIVGPTGSGKSTIANLLLHIYPILGGYIYLDGVNIKQYDVNVLRKHISFTPQKTELFYGTIEQNLKLARPLASHEQVVEAAIAANLLEAVNQLPEGFDMRIRFYGENRFGASFSQRLSLARAYLRDAPILLLDEPTSSLDEANAKIFFDYIRSVKGTKTIIILAHSIQSVELADQVILLNDGYLVGAGSPESVLKNIHQGMI